MKMGYVERIEPGCPEWNEYVGSHLSRYRFGSKFVAGRRVLDAGCGTGYGTRVLLEGGASEIVAVDISEEALASAQKWFSDPRVRFVRDDCEKLAKIDGQFGVIVAFESVEHFHDLPAFLSQVARLLSPNGVFICSTPNALTAPAKLDGRPINPFHEQEYSPDELRQLLRRYFASVLLTGQHPTAALMLGHRINLLWSNPLVRLGWLIQRLRGHRVPWTPPPSIATEGDYVISEGNLEKSEVVIGVCRGPVGN